MPCANFARKGVAGHDQAAAVILSHFPREVREGGADVLITPLVPFAPRGRSAEGRRDGRALGGSVREAGAQVVLVAEFVAPHGLPCGDSGRRTSRTYRRMNARVLLSAFPHALTGSPTMSGTVEGFQKRLRGIEPDIVPSRQFGDSVQAAEVYAAGSSW